ncbi:MAG: aromatic ring-hydroxylating dioxygenase subunit alpha [Bdellovibrionaceae bacterium]|nr:aromatic ring-hydroxylating dioxygenase subunit alpha [Bdellovibrio sp.]
MKDLLKNHWYLALPSAHLKINKMVSLEIMGEPILFFRKSNGEISAICDICPHRGIPLKFGRVVNDQVECPYHGWKFDGGGVCRDIPSLTSEQKLDCTKIKIKSYSLRELYGGIWIFIGDNDFDQSLAPQPPLFAGIPLDAKPQLCEVVLFPCHIDHAVIGLMDPAHGPFVHQSWFWRSTKSIHEKRKQFGPVPFGFQMKRHEPSKNSKAYRILGGEPTTEITFQIPGTRVEHVQVGEKSFYSLTALMPLGENKTQVVQMAFWNIGWLSLAKPLVKQFGRTFLGQDLDAVTKQQEGLKYDPTLMLINDSDTQAKWYFALKKEWQESSEQKRAFANPVKDTTLSWKS